MQKLETVAAVLAALPIKVGERRFRSAALGAGGCARVALEAARL